MDRGTWRATVHEVTNSQAHLVTARAHTHTHTHIIGKGYQFDSFADRARDKYKHISLSLIRPKHRNAS